MLIKQSTATRHIVFFMADSSDHLTGKASLSPTVTLSKNAASFGSPAGAITEIASGWYKLAAHATDSNTLGALILHATATGADPTDLYVGEVVAFDPDIATNLGLSALPTANPGAANGIFIAGTNAATTVTTSFTTTFTGSLTGNVNGSVNSVATAITLPTIPTNWIAAAGIAANALNGKGDWLLSSGYTAPSNLTAAAIAAGVWRDAIAGDFTVAGSIGKSVLNGVTLGTGLTINGYTGDTPQTGDAFARVGAPAGGVSISADMAAVKTDTAAVKLKTDALPAAPAAVGDIPSANANADALLDRAAGVETGLTVRQWLRLGASVLFGKASGLGTTTAVFRDTNDSKDRITATVDDSGNRSAITTDKT